MYLSHIILFVICLGISYGYPRRDSEEFVLEENYSEEEIAKRINAWKPEDKENIWELSGLLEGDILMPISQRENRNGIRDLALRWQFGIVPVKIDNWFGTNDMAVIKGALKDYHNKTCIRFRPYRETDNDFVNIVGSYAGCFSSVGRVQSGQLLNLQRGGCVRHGVVIHEFLHALGFYHQQSASDRDDYVTIHWENIIQGTERNFEKYSEKVITDFDVGYDYGSVMHYSAFGFSKNGQATIVPKVQGATIGQRIGFSQKDINKVQLMYHNHCEDRKNSVDADYDFDSWLLV